jgi:hypothetical protein
MNIPYFLYMAECEGMIDTREGKIQKVIQLLAAADDPNSVEAQQQAFAQVNLNLFSLTSMEQLRIESEVAKRFG